MISIVTIMTMIFFMTIFIIDNLNPSFDSGKDHDEHDNNNDHRTHNLGYEPEEGYDGHIHQSLHPCQDPGEDLDNHDNHIYNTLHTGYDPGNDHDDHCDNDYHYDYDDHIDQ